MASAPAIVQMAGREWITGEEPAAGLASAIPSSGLTEDSSRLLNDLPFVGPFALLDAAAARHQAQIGARARAIRNVVEEMEDRLEVVGVLRVQARMAELLAEAVEAERADILDRLKVVLAELRVGLVKGPTEDLASVVAMLEARS